METKTCRFPSYSDIKDMKSEQLKSTVQRIKQQLKAEERQGIYLVVNPWDPFFKSDKHAWREILRNRFATLHSDSFLLSIGDSPSKFVHALITLDESLGPKGKHLDVAYIPSSEMTFYPTERGNKFFLKWLEAVDFFLQSQGKPSLSTLLKKYAHIYVFDTETSGRSVKVLKEFFAYLVQDEHSKTQVHVENITKDPFGVKSIVSSEGYLSAEQDHARCVRPFKRQELLSDSSKWSPQVCDPSQLPRCLEQMTLLDLLLTRPDFFDHNVK